MILAIQVTQFFLTLIPDKQWIFTVSLTQARNEKEELEAKKRTEEDLQNLLGLLSLTSLEELNHIPPITSSEAFPFQVSLVISNIKSALLN